MMVKRAKYSDIQEITSLAKDFIEESKWGWDFDYKASMETLSNYITSDETDVFLATDDDGSPSGFAMVATDKEFHTKPIGYMTKFYMKKRGTPLTRILVENCCAWFDSKGCKDVFSTATANIPSEGNTFDNLLKKFGFEDCGMTLVRGRV